MSAEETRKEVLALMSQKDKLEAEIQELTSVLQKVSEFTNPLVFPTKFKVCSMGSE